MNTKPKQNTPPPKPIILPTSTPSTKSTPSTNPATPPPATKHHHQHTTQIAEAPDAVPRLRRFILDLAVRGKLVEQDPKDLPALDLSKMPSEHLHESSEDFPSRWVLVHVGAILSLQYGKALSASERLDNGPVPVYGSNGIIGYCMRPLTESPAVIVGRKGSAGALNMSIGPSWTTDVAYFIIPPSFCDIRFLMINLQALKLDKLGKGVKPGLSRSDVYALEMALPPLAEQHRIVAKVDELMTLCDVLEAAQQQRESRRDRLVSASLHALTNGDADPDPETGPRPDFADSTRFYLNHLPRLTTRPEHIKQLRQTILNLAVRGKLAPQDPKSGPTHDTTALVCKERKGLGYSVHITGGNPQIFKKASRLISIPLNWTMAPLGEVVLAIVDCPHSTPVWTKDGKICVRTSQFRPGCLDLSAPRFVGESTFLKRIERLRPMENDILYSREGGILGVACLVPIGVELCLGQRMMLIRSSSTLLPRFLEMVLNSPFITSIALTETTGGAAPRVNVSTVKAYPIPIPPLAEQHRIVAKVDELMALCDALESKILDNREHWLLFSKSMLCKIQHYHNSKHIKRDRINEM